METVHAVGKIDISSLSREFRSTVFRAPQRIEDLGPIKIVHLAMATMVLIDGSALALVTEGVYSQLKLPRDHPVFILQSGFNVDAADRAICAGEFLQVNASAAIGCLRGLVLTGSVSRIVQPNSVAMRSQQKDRRQNISPRPAELVATAQHGPLYHSAPMRRLDAELERFAKFEFDVLILGETGAGKDVAASEIHKRSRRRYKPFITVPISSLCDTLIESELFGHVRGAYSGAHNSQPGKFEAAEGGTVYIPEISNLSMSAQLKLLHFMQYKKCLRVGEDPRHEERLCDVRLVMASNENLEECVRSGKMREDFYYRIKGLSIEIPPLRERKEAIPILIQHFLIKYDASLGRKHTFTAEAIEWMMRLPWRGNVRELESVVRTLTATSADGTITKDQLIKHYCRKDEHEGGADPLFDIPLSEFPSYCEYSSMMQKRYIESALRHANGCVARAAHISGMTPFGIRKAMERLGINKGALPDDQ
ncbi:MAG: sigma 54-interacting transcriptional regulator [Bacteroidota bacterium]|jgi:transcriptional regulator with GAF, ATPase, and Fis domain